MCMPNLFDLILEHPLDAAFTAVILVSIGVSIFLNRRDVLLKSALYIVAKVEDEWGSGTGRIKFAEAYTYLKAKYPIATFFLPEDKLTEIIEDALDELKKILESKASEVQNE